MHTPLRDIVLKMKSLEPFPDVATRVLELSAREDVVPGELIELVQTDPGITSKVLKLCNSAYYGFQREIASLHEAGNLLGVTTLVNLVLTSSAGKYFRDYGEAKGESHERLWEHCVANAISSRIIARRHGQVDPERAYTAGLLGNIGNLVLNRFLDDGREAIRAVAKSGCTLIEAERRVLGLNHAEIGARLTTRWGLPDVLVDTIRNHHVPEKAKKEPILAATIHVAEVVTRLGLDGEDMVTLDYDVSKSALTTTGLTRDNLAVLGEELRGELERARDFLQT